MPKRQCKGPRCHELIEIGSGPYCDGCKPKYSSAAKQLVRKAELQSTRWYNSKPWRLIRVGHLLKHPWCTDPDRRHPGRMVEATDLDHIEPHKEDYDKFWDAENRQGLCKSCHSHKTVNEDGGFGRARKQVSAYGA